MTTPSSAGQPAGPSVPPTSRRKAFPIGWVTSGRRLLLVGGCRNPQLCRLRHAIEFDWRAITAYLPVGEPAFCPQCLADQRVKVIHGTPTDEDVTDHDLVIESTADQALARDLDRWCSALRIPLNTEDKLDSCDFHYPSMVMKGPLLLAILTGGQAPALASRMRKWLDEQIGPGWETAARLLSEARENLPAGQARSNALKDIVANPDLIGLIETNDEPALRELISHAIDRLRT